MKKDYEIVKEQFKKDVKDHHMEIIKDDGLYRHIRFKRKDSLTYYYDLITWKGYLCICGDMDTYVFCRIEDMFHFFLQPDTVEINPGYWSEKLQSIDKTGYEEFDPDVFKERIEEYWNEWEFESEAIKLEVWKDIGDSILSFKNDSEHEAMSAAFNYKSDYGHELQDFWETNCRSYTYGYLWCLYAIVHGIKMYQDSKK